MFVVRVIQNTNSGVGSHTKHKYLCFFSIGVLVFVFRMALTTDTSIGVCCESHTKHKYWCLF